MKKSRFNRTNPSLHLLALMIVFALALAGYFAVMWSGDLKGYSPSRTVAFRDLLFFIPIVGMF
ncbi:MAG: hypothetical protein AB1631_33715, partial [Acidobacteriota bacterium]